MLHRHTRSVSAVLLFAALSISSWSQHTFRGGINGTVTDQSGAVVSGATVEIMNVATNVSLKTTTTSAGEYAFPELNIGKYDITVTAAGFNQAKVTGVPVSAGQIFTQMVKLVVATSAETIEVAADAFTLDTTTTTQTTTIDAQAVDDAPLNGRDFTQLATLTPGFANSGAGGYGSLNGTRANQINWQIDGVDNNDIWHNIPAVNQGGVSGIAGIILPIDSVEQFSVQTNASADTGRNPGGTATLGLKSGTNRLHGSAYYFNRNEMFGKKSPFTANKQKVRDYNAGGSLGGPVLRDKLFYFLNYEQQRFVIGVPQQATEPTTKWQQYAADVVTSNGKSVSPISSGLLTLLWPSYALTSPASESVAPVVGNYVSPDPEFGYSYNGVGKIDYAINGSNSISAHWFGGQGNQVAPVGSALLPYYEVAPIHVQNWQLTYNHTFLPTLTNQIVAGVNYFNQVFNDNKTGYDVTSVGLMDGSPFKSAPKLQISGFDSTGRTPPEGRNDITGQISDNITWVKGKHQARFGGEFRRVSLNEFYHRNAQGNFKFNGAQGNWDLSKSSLASAISDSSITARISALADFLAGDVYTSTITLGDPERTVYVHTFGAFAQDSYQVTKKVNVNFGLRWDYEGPLANSKKDLSVFRPSQGIVFQGNQVSSVYDPTYTNFSPRLGISYQANEKMVIRAGAGIYFDTPNINPFLDNRPGNNAPNGLEGNPAGPNPVFNISASSYTWQPNVDPFGSATTPTCTADNPCGVFSVQKSFKPSNNINYNLQVERSFGSNVIAQIGYVGSEGHHLLSIVDLNQSLPNADGVDQTSRPFYGAFPEYGNINEIQSIGNSNYNSLQATLRASNFHHFTASTAYTWSHAFDDVTAYRGALPQNSKNFKGDYGQGDFDTRNILVGELSYEVPGAHMLRPVTNGWQFNSVFAFHSGLPFSVLTDDQTDNTGEGNQRANQVLSNPYAGFKKQAVGANWLNPDAFADPAAGTWGTTHRNAYVAPGFGDVDFSIFKNTKIGERINTQFRLEFYNVFNRTNFAPPLGVSGSYNPNQASISTLQLYDTIGDFNGAPGIGAGEPFNTQLAMKITF